MTESIRARADDGFRTRLIFVGNEAPRQAASSALVPPVGLEPTHFRVRTGCSAFELRRQCRGDRRRSSTTRATREAWGRRAPYSVFRCPVGTVSLSFRCELSLGKPSIHVCCSQLRFGSRESNSHFQPKPDRRRPGESRTLTSRSKNPVRCRYATDLSGDVLPRTPRARRGSSSSGLPIASAVISLSYASGSLRGPQPGTAAWPSTDHTRPVRIGLRAADG
jgi:hypothetical protein